MSVAGMEMMALYSITASAVLWQRGLNQDAPKPTEDKTDTTSSSRRSDRKGGTGSRPVFPFFRVGAPL